MISANTIKKKKKREEQYIAQGTAVLSWNKAGKHVVS